MAAYDFLLFENYHQAQNHKFDLVLIARLLQHARLEVAIVDIYHEDKLDETVGIPVVHLQYQHSIPNDKWQLHPKNKFHSLLCTIRFLWQQNRYMRHAWKEIEPLADRFYCGSYHLMMPMTFFRSKKPCYYWGLRSSRMADFWKHFKRNPIIGIRMLRLKHAFMKSPSQCMFVSNEIIKKEFENLGIDDKRLVIREERCTNGTEKPHYERLSTNFSILTIGMLRPEKRIDFTVREFLSASEGTNWTYTLAGKSQNKYEEVVDEAIKGHNNIIRINEYMDYDRFYELIRKSHFVVLADKQQLSSVTNGTMMEALINYRPIIAPNYNPYKYYIEKFGVGVMFNPDKPGDLARAITEAERLGTKSFEDNIRKYLSTIEFTNVSNQLYRQIYRK